MLARPHGSWRAVGRCVTCRRRTTAEPALVEAVYQRAIVSASAGDFAGATRWYEKATSMQPQNAETWLALGTFLFALYEKDGRPGDACAAYGALNHAYTLDPKGRQWVPGVARLRAARGQRGRVRRA